MDSRICGHVADPAALAVPDATVLITASDEPTPDIAALTDADGHFTFDGLAPGSYTLRAQAATGESGSVCVTTHAATTTAVLVTVVA